MHRYLLIDIYNTAIAEIEHITRARNRLIHFGKIPDGVDLKEMTMFIRLTEQLPAIVLGLEPSNALNSFDHLQKFLQGKKAR